MTVFPGFYSFFSTFIPPVPFGKTRVRPPPNQKLLITQQKISRTIAVSNAHLWATITSFYPREAISDSPSYAHIGSVLRTSHSCEIRAYWERIAHEPLVRNSRILGAHCARATRAHEALVRNTRILGAYCTRATRTEL